MPLHDWIHHGGWEGVRHIWITEVLRWVKPRLPSGYRAYIGSAPTLAVGAPNERPDVAVRQWSSPVPSPPADSPVVNAAGDMIVEPDEEVAVASLDTTTSLFVETQGRLAAAVELISPRNKDRPAARASYLMRYVGYLMQGVHLLLIDVHRRPMEFSFADAIAAELAVRQPALPPPHAIAYRVGEPAAAGGRNLGLWRRRLQVEQPLPMMQLPITLDVAVSIDLESTYMHAAADAYLD